MFLSLANVLCEGVFSRLKAEKLVVFASTKGVQFVLTLLLLPVQGLEIFGGVPISSLAANFIDGLRCMIGQEGQEPWSASGPTCDRTTAVLFWGFQFLDIPGYLVMLHITKIHGASVTQIASAVSPSRALTNQSLFISAERAARSLMRQSMERNIFRITLA